MKKLLLLVGALAGLVAGAGNLAVIEGGDEYATLEAAIGAAQNGDRVRLLANQTSNCKVTKLTKSLTLDLDGKTLTCGGYSSAAYFIVVNGTDAALEIVNGSIVCGDGCNGPAKVTKGSLTMDGVTVSGAKIATIMISKDMSATLTDCSITSASGLAGVYVNGGTAELTDTKVSITGVADASKAWQSASVAVTGGGTVTITGKGGEYSGEDLSLAVNSSSTGKITVRGGTFTGAFAVPNKSSLEICGGTFDEDPTDYVNTDCYDVDEPEIGVFVVSQKGLSEDTVAQIDTEEGETFYFDSFDAALAELKSGDYLTLIQDATMSKPYEVTFPCTLDFEGCKVTGSFASGYAFYCAESNAVADTWFEICDGSFECAFCDGFIKVDGTGVGATLTELVVNNSGNSGEDPEVWAANGSTLNINGCKIYGDSRYYAAVLSSRLSSITMEDTSVTVPAPSAKYYNCAIATSYGGTIEVNGSGTYEGYTYGAYIWSSGGAITINGGTFKATAGSDGYALRADYANSQNAGATSSCTITVNDGAIDGVIWGRGTYSPPGRSTKIYLNGGTYTNFSITDGTTSNDKIVINDGQYDHDPSNWAKEGYEGKLNEETGMYEIVEKFIAKVTGGAEETSYTTVAAAIAAAKAGAGTTVVILKPIEGAVAPEPGVTVVFAAGQDMSKVTCGVPDRYDAGVYNPVTQKDGSVKLVLDETAVRPIYAAATPFAVSDATVSIAVGNPKKGLSYAIAQAGEVTDEYVPVAATWTSGAALKGGAVLQMSRPSADRQFYRIAVKDLND